MATKKTIVLIRRSIPLIMLVGVFVCITMVVWGKTPSLPSLASSPNAKDRLWEYQCIDTMKTSRDKARVWKDRKDLDELIAKEMKAIKAMGANCVALDTPYDEEFLPFMKKWVKAARREKLLIWYRGNFSSWEGWFEYKKSMTEEQLFTKTTAFIKKNPYLFEDGDVFTPAPEAENGGPFEQVEKDEHEAFRAFLLREHDVAKKAFTAIGKDVSVNWMSMNGGLAKRMFDMPTIQGLGNTVTLDHYIKTAPEMGEFIQYFATNYNAKTVIGEFGAPIPEINGPMSEKEQADFINELFMELYEEKEHVIGVNYWVLYDSSTELYNKDFTPRLAVDVVKRYFIPGKISGRITDEFGTPLSGVTIVVNNGKDIVTTNKGGNYTVLIPQDTKVALHFSKKGYLSKGESYTLEKNKRNLHLTLTPQHTDGWYSVRKFFKDIF